jgi:hypothetical protein
MNEQLKARLKGMREVLMAHYHATRLLPNSAKGDEREVLVRELLEKVFPTPYRFGCGAVTDSDGRVSGQLDVICRVAVFCQLSCAPRNKPSVPCRIRSLRNRGQIEPQLAMGAS